MSDLVADLTAVLDRAEALAKAAQAVRPTPWRVSDQAGGGDMTVLADDSGWLEVATCSAERETDSAGYVHKLPQTAVPAFIAAMSPDQVLVLVGKARKVIDRHQPLQLPMVPDGYAICPWCDKGPPPLRHVKAPCPDLLDEAEAWCVTP